MFGCDDIMSRDSDHPGEMRKLNRQQQGVAEAGYSVEAVGRLIIVEGELDKLACNEVLHGPFPGTELHWVLWIISRPSPSRFTLQKTEFCCLAKYIDMAGGQGQVDGVHRCVCAAGGAVECCERARRGAQHRAR